SARTTTLRRGSAMRTAARRSSRTSQRMGSSSTVSRSFERTISRGGVDALASGSGNMIEGSSIRSWFAISGVTTMKMMRSTSTTSTRGVTLMLGRARGSGRKASLPIEALVPLEVVAEFCRGGLQAEVGAVDLSVQGVEEQNRGDGATETDARHDERLRDAGGNRGETSGPGLGDPLESGDDAEHRSEEADEGGDRRHGGEEVHSPTAVETDHLQLASQLAPGEFHRHRLARRRAEAFQVGAKAGAEHARERMPAFLGLGDEGLVAARPHAVRGGLGQGGSLALPFSEGPKPVDGDGDYGDGHRREGKHHTAGGDAHLLPDFHEIHFHVSVSPLVTGHMRRRKGMRRILKTGSLSPLAATAGSQRVRFTHSTAAATKGSSPCSTCHWVILPSSRMTTLSTTSPSFPAARISWGKEGAPLSGSMRGGLASSGRRTGFRRTRFRGGASPCPGSSEARVPTSPCPPARPAGSPSPGGAAATAKSSASPSLAASSGTDSGASNFFGGGGRSSFLRGMCAGAETGGGA